LYGGAAYSPVLALAGADIAPIAICAPPPLPPLLVPPPLPTDALGFDDHTVLTSFVTDLSRRRRRTTTQRHTANTTAATTTTMIGLTMI
jgi:hypothetical protein